MISTEISTRTVMTNSTALNTMTKDMDYSDYIFGDGIRMQDYIACYVMKYGVDRNELIKDCNVHAMRVSLTFSNFDAKKRNIGML